MAKQTLTRILLVIEGGTLQTIRTDKPASYMLFDWDYVKRGDMPEIAFYPVPSNRRRFEGALKQMKRELKVYENSHQACHCDNCKWQGPQYHLRCQLEKVPDLAARLDPGSVVPAGECPNCGALAYLVK